MTITASKPTGKNAAAGHKRDAAGFGLRFLARYLLQYGLLPWALAVQVGVEIAVLFQRGGQWRGDLVWTIDWLPVSLIVVGPVIAGFAALDMARMSVGTAHLFRNRLLRTPAAGIAAAYILCVSLVHLAVLTGALIASMPPVGDLFAPLAVLVQLLILAFFVALGTAIGRFVAPILAGITAALAGFAAVYLVSSPGDNVALLEYGGATIPRVGYAYDPVFLIGQAVMLGLCCVALLLLRPVDGQRLRSLTRRDGLIAGAAVALAVVISFVVPTDRLRSVQAEPTYCGATQGIPTCFYPQHERIAEPFQDQFWILAGVARENGYDDLLPDRMVEASRTQLPQSDDPMAGAFYVQPDHLQGFTPSLWEIASGIVQPVHCPQVQGEEAPSEQYWEDLNALTATWVELAEPGISEEMGYFGEPLSPDEASAMVNGFRTCTYENF